MYLEHEPLEFVKSPEIKTSLQQFALEVWLVEDNNFYRQTIEGVLVGSGEYQTVRSFSSCEDALKQFSKGDIPDVILQDIQLPGINGIEGIALYKKVCPSAHVIMLTVYDDDENLFNAMCAGASGYLMKNSPQDAIVRSIQEVMNGGAPMNPHIATKVLHLFSKFVNQKNDYGLTQREKEILQEVVNGLTIQQIADKLFLSYHTVNTHLKNIYSKLQVNTRSGVIAKAFKEHLI